MLNTIQRIFNKYSWVSLQNIRLDKDSYQLVSFFGTKICYTQNIALGYLIQCNLRMLDHMMDMCIGYLH